jgi:hypothetical protein
MCWQQNISRTNIKHGQQFCRERTENTLQFYKIGLLSFSNIGFRSQHDHGAADDEIRVAAPHRIGPHPTADGAHSHRDRYPKEKITCKSIQ